MGWLERRRAEKDRLTILLIRGLELIEAASVP